MTDLARAVYDHLHRLPDLYEVAHKAAHDVAIPAPVQGGRRGKPTSRPPAGADVEARVACVKAARLLADADMLLAEVADWPTLPWQPVRLGGPGWEPCRACGEAGLRAVEGGRVVEVVQGTFVPLDVVLCASCDGDGWVWTWRRRDASSPELVPPHPHVVRSVCERVRGKVGALEVRDLLADPTPALLAAQGAWKALAGYATPPVHELPPPCSSCKEYRDIKDVDLWHCATCCQRRWRREGPKRRAS